MSKKIIGIGIILLIVGLSGCIDGGDEKVIDIHPDEFVGTWANKEIPAINFTLTKDGEYSWGVTQGGTWEVKEEKLVLDINDLRTEFDYVFSENNQELELTTSGTSITYIKL